MSKPDAPSLIDILKPVNRDLERVSDRLLACLQNPVARLVAYLIMAGGKRLRPALVLLAGQSGDEKKSRAQLLDLAAAVELVHTATLIHDDIIDRSALRRQQPTFHSRFGTERAVLMGDYLYATAFQVLAQLQAPYVMTFMAEVCQQMSRGEFQEVDCRYKLDMTEEEYFQIVRDKTASLIAASCHLGAQVSGASPAAIERITQFGWDFGLAFQIVDDCLDLIGEEKTVGKPLRSDLDKGALSLPVIYLAGSMSRRERNQLFAPMKSGTADRRFFTRVAKEARRSGAVDRAIRTAETLIGNATKAIALNDGVSLASTYHQLAGYAIRRVQ